MPVLRRPAAAAGRGPYTHIGEHEEGLIAQWMADGMEAKDIAALLRRDLSTVARRMDRIRSGQCGMRAGRPSAVTPAVEAKVLRAAERLVQAAKGEWQVTAAMIKDALKLKCCDRVILDTLHRNGVYFRPMRQKPVLTPEDVRERLAFAEKYGGKPATFWQGHVHAYLDNKFFKTYLTPKARAYARKLRPRGTFRAPGQGLDAAHVKPPKDLKQNFGKSVQVSVAISAKRVLACHVVNNKWNKHSASSMYKDVLGPALHKVYPGKRRFLVLEDNDPAGYKSILAKDTKQAMGVDVLELPKRSPDLNPLDYAFWSHVNDRLRSQEEKFGGAYTETRSQFVKRLRRTILRTRPQVLGGMISNMKRRCELLQASAGHHFEEGS